MRLNNFFKALFGKKEQPQEIKNEVKEVDVEVVSTSEVIEPITTQKTSLETKKTTKKEVVVAKKSKVKNNKNKGKIPVIKQLKK